MDEIENLIEKRPEVQRTKDRLQEGQPRAARSHRVSSPRRPDRAPGAFQRREAFTLRSLRRRPEGTKGLLCGVGREIARRIADYPQSAIQNPLSGAF